MVKEEYIEKNNEIKNSLTSINFTKKTCIIQLYIFSLFMHEESKDITKRIWFDLKHIVYNSTQVFYRSDQS